MTGSGGATPPVARTRFATADLDEAVEAIAHLYTRFEPASPRRQPSTTLLAIDATTVSSPAGNFGVDRVHYTMTVRASTDPMPTPSVVVPISGHVNYTLGDRECGPMTLLPTRNRFDFEVDDADVLVPTVHTAAVARIGADMAGIDPSDVRFTDMSPVGPAQARMFRSLVLHLARNVLPSDEALASPIARAETCRHLATSMLLAYPNTALDAVHDPTRPGPGHSEPAVVRRAVEFIESHADQPIGLAEIAAAAGVGARGLQHAFRRHRDTTPLQHLRRVRLARAHADLHAGDPTRGDTVAAIATRWGFTHHGRFSAHYQQVYGRSPSDTLRN